MFYKNYSYTAKTFYGVTFKPGEVKEVDGIINDRWVLPVRHDSATASKSASQQKPSPELPKEVPLSQPSPVEIEAPKIEEPTKPEEKQSKGKKS